MATVEDYNYVSKKLSILKEQMDRAEQYLSENPWYNIKDDTKKEKEFRFQKDLTESLMGWTESYIKMSGIMDVYNRLELSKGKSALKSGQEVSGIQRFVKERAKKS